MLLERVEPWVLVTGVNICCSDWIHRSGPAIGDNQWLNIIDFNYGMRGEETWLAQLCQGLVRNRSIELLRLRTFYQEPGLDVFQVLTPFFEHNCNLRFVELYEAGPRTFSSLVNVLTACKTSRLEGLSIGSRSISVEGIVVFLDSLINKSSLLELRLQHMNLQTMGCESLAKLIENPLSNIQTLKLLDVRLGANGVARLGNALAFNKTLQYSPCLKKLHLYLVQEDADTVFDRAWEVLDRVLCDKTDIGSTYFSNHTLERLIIREHVWDDNRFILLGVEKHIPYDIHVSLALNGNKDKVEVARQKILKGHFQGGHADFHVFTCMPESVLVHAIEWMGRNNKPGLKLMYDFVRGYPTLFCTRDGSGDVAVKKRKCS